MTEVLTHAAPALQIHAGPDALAELRDGGLRASRVRVLVGASGGPKWFVLHGLDRVLFPWLRAGLTQPLHAVGSSIGSWRLACLALPSPADAIERLAEAYVEQRYSRTPAAAEISAGGERILDALLGAHGPAALVDDPLIKLHVITARFLHLGALEGRAQFLGVGMAALVNALDRRALATALERVVFDTGGDPGPFAPWRMLPTRHVTLTAENVRKALAASGAIPGVMSGVRDIPGAPSGTYRDGGVADYHFGAEIDPQDGIALYPHFYAELVPGWFDKALPWRRTRGLRRVVLIAPSAAHVAALPGGRIPDRNDFTRMRDSERIAAWRQVLALGQRLGQELGELLDTGRIAHVAQQLP
jgi:hypothetical protein